MRFADAVYPLRHDRLRMVRRLHDALPKSFTEVVHVRGMLRHGPTNLPYDRTTIGGNRTTRNGLRIVNSQLPSSTDRAVLRALLRGWGREISDRYLDLTAVLRAEQHLASPDTPELMRSLNAITSQAEADARMRANYPSGCVKFIVNELAVSSLPLFGDNVPPDMSFNEYYSALLVWDDFHLTGLTAYIRRQTHLRRAGDGGEVNLIIHAANAWVSRAQRTPGNVYYAIQNE